jgi:hypothetical protein
MAIREMIYFYFQPVKAMMIDGIEGVMEANTNFNAETQSFDGSASGEIAFSDGSSLQFSGVENINFDVPV